jgi:integrase
MIISGSRSPNSRSVCKRDHKRIRSCNAAPDRSTQHDRLDRNELGELLVAAGLGTAAEHVLMSLLAINGLRISEALGADVDDLGLERGHRTLTVLGKGGKLVTIPLAPRTARAIDLAIGEHLTGADLSARGRGADGPAQRRADRAPGRPSRRISEEDQPAHPAARVHYRRA